MTLLEELRTEAVNHDLENGWTRESVNSIAEHRDRDLLKPFKHAWLSPHSLTVRDTKVRKVIGEKVSSGEVGRLYLKRTMAQALEAGGNKMLAKRIPWHHSALQFEDRLPAYFFAGQTGGPFEMVDIKACYATLYTRLTIDLVYRPETNPPLLGFGKGNFPRVGEWMQEKAPRNALWGSTLRRFGGEYRHGEFFDNAFANQFYAPDLKGIVLDAAHAIATEARDTFKALSWAVDGGVFRPGDGYAFIGWLEASWGLTGEIRAEGPGWMFGPASYQIGGTLTEDVRAGRAKQASPNDGLRPQRDYQRRWLADVFVGRTL
jgi:hypothetical protein